MKNIVRFAILGCGRISTLHINAIKNAPNGELVAVCDLVEEKAKNIAEAEGLPRYYTDFKDMLENEEIDVVNICTPSGMHCEHTLIAAEFKKNVLCEKPLDVTLEKIDKMIKGCEENGVLLGGIFQRRSSTAAKYTKDAIEKGKLGRLILADASLKYYRDQEYYDSGEWRGTWELDGGGALMNQGIHGIDMLQWIAGEVESVTAYCKRLTREIEVEDTAVVLVKFKHGGMGVIEGATSISPGQDTVFAMQGDKGTITFGDKGFYTWVTEDGSVAPDVNDTLGGLNCGWDSGNIGHILQVQDMAEAVLTGKQPMITGQEARKAVEIVLAIYESSKLGKEIKLHHSKGESENT